MAAFVSVYVTTPSRAVAAKMARTLVRERLAACANILPGVQSIYRWQGRMETAREAVLILKTRKSLFARLEKRVKQMHSYACPCIVAWPIAVGHKPYLDWIAANTKSKETK